MSKLLEEAAALEQKNKVSAETGHNGSEPDARLQEAVPVLAYEEIPPRKTETELRVKLVRKKSRKGGLIALAALVVATGLGFAAYRLGVLDGINVLDGIGVENVTEPPSGANVPVFSPIDPADFSAVMDGDLVVVPDETGLELPAFGHGPQIAPTPQNHYIQTPHVSEYFIRAAQDESYVYFLQNHASFTDYNLYKLMRANPSTGKTEPATNADDPTIYSFALLGHNIITCEYEQDTDTFAFYRNPKSGEHAQLLFETDSPANMSVFDNKLFMFFLEEQALGVFDPASDTQPSYIVLEPLEEEARYFPQFSVVNGYFYYGAWYDTSQMNQEEFDYAAWPPPMRVDLSTAYFRRSLYTGETATLLSREDGEVAQHPCWDEDGGSYYAQYSANTSSAIFYADKDGGSPQTVSRCDYGESWPIVALRDELLIATVSRYELRQFDRTDFSLKLESTAERFPYAVTKDFIVTYDGLYRLFDFGFIPFE